MTNIGYACIALGVPFCQQKTIQLRYLSQNKLSKIIETNLDALENIIDYNHANNIFLFRVSSDLIPFGSSSHNQLDWIYVYKDRLNTIRQKITSCGMRVSMHPGQYTILNSPHNNVVENSILDLEYHYSLLNSLSKENKSKIILHIGGVYGDKKESIKRFMTCFNLLDERIKERLVIENDDKFYSIEDTLEISKKIRIPVIFDVLHHQINPPEGNTKDINYWIKECNNTFKETDGKQKIHYSEQNILGKKGSHSQTINAQTFLDFYTSLDNKDLDIMLEVKDKNLSAIKCMNMISEKKDITFLEVEWARYKYKILENDQNDYLDIRNLLKDKSSYPVSEFYKVIDSSLQKTPQKSFQLNAALHIWGYFKNRVSDEQKNKFFQKLKKFESGTMGIAPVKKLLFDYAYQYNDKYLLNSYYFYI